MKAAPASQQRTTSSMGWSRYSTKNSGRPPLVAAGWKPLGAARTLWMQLRVHRTSLSSAAPFDTDGRLDASHSSARWLPDLRIAGERREALLCDSNSTFVFQVPAGRGARLRLRCAIMPEAHDRILHGITFAATVRSTSADPPWERSASRLLRPWHWRDRRWRPITVEVPR